MDLRCPSFYPYYNYSKLYYTGETADTLNALRYCHSARARIVGVTNTVGSSISKESDCGIHINAGPEIGVASTKAYTSQVISLIMFALVMSEDSYKKQERRKHGKYNQTTIGLHIQVIYVNFKI